MAVSAPFGQSLLWGAGPFFLFLLFSWFSPAALAATQRGPSHFSPVMRFCSSSFFVFAYGPALRGSDILACGWLAPLRPLFGLCLSQPGLFRYGILRARCVCAAALTDPHRDMPSLPPTYLLSPLSSGRCSSRCACLRLRLRLRAANYERRSRKCERVVWSGERQHGGKSGRTRKRRMEDGTACICQQLRNRVVYMGGPHHDAGSLAAGSATPSVLCIGQWTTTRGALV
jgi:hypothetical protein